jgi:hypothetical protein
MDGFRPTPTRAWLPAALVAVIVALAGCAPAASGPLTAGQRNEICHTLRDSVVVAAASAVYSPVYLYRSYGPRMPGGTGLPYPDCAYLARSEFADRIEVFYFGPDEDEIIQELTDQLSATGYQEQGDRWILLDADGQPHAIARVEQFYAAQDADEEFRPYAELIGKPAVVISITSRRY